jgi:hypothetical protein
MRAPLMLGALVMRASHGVCAIRTRYPACAMHWTRHNWHGGAAQRRDPRRKKNDGQIDGEQSAHHAANLQLASPFRVTKQCKQIEAKTLLVAAKPH